MTRADAISATLTKTFSPQALEVIDESARHHGHAGARPEGETHYAVHIVSAAFEGVSRVERQRRVYAVLEDQFRAGLHALSLKALTPAEARTAWRLKAASPSRP
jgi:BolA protein